jgi:hypothetical protein
MRYSTLRTIEKGSALNHSTRILGISLFCGLFAVNFSSAQTSATPNTTPATTNQSPLARHYPEGEKLIYHMKGDNDGWTYEVQANGVVKKNASGHLIEEYGWSDLKSSAPMSLSATSLSFRQTLSLDPATPPRDPESQPGPDPPDWTDH